MGDRIVESKLLFKNFANRIKMVRLDAGMTVATFAEILDISDSYVGQMERAGRLPSLSLLVKISCTLNISVDYLLFGNNPKQLIIDELFDKNKDLYNLVNLIRICDFNKVECEFLMSEVKAFIVLISECDRKGGQL